MKPFPVPALALNEAVLVHRQPHCVVVLIVRQWHHLQLLPVHRPS